MTKNCCHKIALLLLFCGLLALSACAKYTTPGGSVHLSSLADESINELMSKEPAAQFPANIAIARIQASGYHSYNSDSYGSGRYSVVTTREVETEEDFERLSQLDEVRAVAPLNRIIISPNLDSLKTLREAAARLKADVLLVYTFDTSFHVGGQRYKPLNVIALGFLKNKEVSVTTTASAAFYDVRTEYLYGLSESTAKESRKSDVWGSEKVVDELRVSTEKTAFTQLMSELERTWIDIVRELGAAS